MPIEMTDLYQDQGTVASQAQTGGQAQTDPNAGQINMNEVAQADATLATAPDGVTVNNVTSQDAVASQGTAGQVDLSQAGGNASATGYQAATGQVTPEMTSQYQMSQITGKDSPLMQRAREEGKRIANRRGLMNSSIAAGSSMGAMVDRAMPMAQQDAATHFNMGQINLAAQNESLRFNAAAENTASLTNAQLNAQAAETNAKLQSEMEALNAQLETAVSQGNQQEANRINLAMSELQARADMQNQEIQARIEAQNASMQTDVDLANAAQWNNALSQNAAIGADLAKANADRFARLEMFNAEQQNQIRDSIMRQNTELNLQFMKGEQALDLATIQGKYQVLISQNNAAAQLYDSYMGAIANAMANDKIKPDRVAGYVRTLQGMLNGGLDMIDTITSQPISGVDPTPAETPTGTSGGTPDTGTGGTGGDTGGTTEPQPPGGYDDSGTPLDPTSPDGTYTPPPDNYFANDPNAPPMPTTPYDVNDPAWQAYIQYITQNIDLGNIGLSF